MTTYEHNADLAGHVVWAEVRHFVANIGLHGYTDDEVQTLTRAIQFRIDMDLKWTDVDELIMKALELLSVENCQHEWVEINESRTVDNRPDLKDRILADAAYEIDLMVSRVRPHLVDTVWKPLAA